MVLQGRRQDLAARRAAAVDHAHHREVQLRSLVEAGQFLLAALTRTDAHDQAVIDEQVGNLARRRQQLRRR